MRRKNFLASVLCLSSIFVFSCVLNVDEIVTDEEEKVVQPQGSAETTYSELEQTNIPIVQITVLDGSSVDSKTVWKAASFQLDAEYCGLENLTLDEIQIKGRGNSSWNLPKKPYSIKLPSKEKILGLPKSKRWVLIANYSDKTLLRNYFVSKLGNNIYNTVWNPSFKSVHLIVNGEYQGVYLLGESIRIDKNRVNIEDLSKNDDGGFIFEINVRLDEKLNFITDNNVCISLKDPDEVDEEKWNFIKDKIQSAENLLFSEDFTDSESGYTTVFDVDSVIDWYIMNELGKNVDSAYFSSIYFYYDSKDNLLHMGPNWDFDLAFGNANYTHGSDPADICTLTTSLYVKENSVWIKQMFSDPAFTEKLKNRWNETKSELQNYINCNLQNYADELASSAERNFEKWQILGIYVWPNASGYENRTTYQSEVDYMIQWLNARYSFLDQAFNAL